MEVPVPPVGDFSEWSYLDVGFWGRLRAGLFSKGSLCYLDNDNTLTFVTSICLPEAISLSAENRRCQRFSGLRPFSHILTQVGQKHTMNNPQNTSDAQENILFSLPLGFSVLLNLRPCSTYIFRRGENKKFAECRLDTCLQVWLPTSEIWHCPRWPKTDLQNCVFLNQWETGSDSHLADAWELSAADAAEAIQARGGGVCELLERATNDLRVFFLLLCLSFLIWRHSSTLAGEVERRRHAFTGWPLGSEMLLDKRLVQSPFFSQRTDVLAAVKCETPC